MDFTIDRAELLAGIDKCHMVVPDAKHPTEAFRLMTVHAANKKKEKARFTAVGEFASVDTVGKAVIQTPGSFNAIPGHLHAVVSAMPPGGIQFTMKETRVTAKSLVAKRKSTFESHSLEVKAVEDPGEGAAWQEVDAHELVKALGMAKSASTWIDRSDPIASLLIPDPGGLKVFGCNMYLLALVETSIRMDGAPIIIPAMATSVLNLMAPIDANVKLFADQHRIYLENCDTLVSARLFDYPFIENHKHMLTMFTETTAKGPTFSIDRLAAGVKSLHGLGSFAGASERNDYGFSMKVTFGEMVRVGLDLAAAGGHDEFDVIEPGAEISVHLWSNHFQKMLASFDGAELKDTQALLSGNPPSEMLVLRSKGITYGLMTKVQK